MPWSMDIGSIAGTRVKIHVTFLMLLAFIWISHWSKAGAAAALEGTLFVALIFACVLAHEFGHILMARRFGVATSDVTLFALGGVANLERIPEKPSQELAVALAGPAVNVGIGLVLLLVIGAALEPADLLKIEDPGPKLLVRLAGANLFLAVFNLVPAFPMDGGRVLRALLAMRMGLSRATALAARIGQGFAFLLGFIGLFINPMLIFIAIFVYLGAAAEAGHVAMKDATRGLPVDEGMMTSFVRLGPGATLNEAVDALIRTSQKEFPVVDGAGRLRGLLTRDQLIVGLREHGSGHPVMEVMTRDIPTLAARFSLDRAVETLAATRAPALAVLDGDERLIGLVTPENLAELLMVRSTGRV